VRPDDSELVIATREGDREAFAELLRRYRDAAFGVAYHRTGEAATAEDLTQDAFVQAYLRLGELRDPGRFAPWLFAITRNLCNQHQRARNHETAGPVPETSVDGLERQAATRDLVQRALASLPPDNGLAITLFYVDGYSYGEISSFLGVPTSTLKGRIERGRRKLREEMVAMLKEHLEARKPGADLDEMVIERLSTADIWALPARAWRERLPHGFAYLDGELAMCWFSGGRGCTGVQTHAEFVAVDDAPVCVFQVVGTPSRYYVFGKGRVLPDGPVIENQLVEASVCVQPRPATTRKSEPWQPERVSSAAVWAMAPAERDRWMHDLYRRSGQMVMLDGGPAFAHLVNGDGSSATCTPGNEVYFRNRGPGRLNVYRATWPTPRYRVFGDAEVTPPGITVSNGTVSIEAVLVGSVPEFFHERGQVREELAELSAADLWALDARAQADILSPHRLAKIDGHLCEARLTGGRGTGLGGTALIEGSGDEGWALYRSLGNGNRYYVFGRAQTLSPELVIQDQPIDTSLTISPAESEAGSWAPHELTVADLQDLSGPGRDDLVHHRLRASTFPLLGGGLAAASLIGGEPGSSCGTPGDEVRFLNVGEDVLHVFRWWWPESVYFIFGEAEVSPPGLRVRDAVIRLQAVGMQAGQRALRQP